MSLAANTLDELLEQLQAPAPSPCGGATAAITAAMACSLVTMVATANPGWDGAAAVAARAGELRSQLVDLAWRDTQAVAGLVQLPRLTPAQRSDALAHATRTPAEIRDAARETATLAELAETNAKRSMRADATAARLLATAAASAADEIVAANSG